MKISTTILVVFLVVTYGASAQEYIYPVALCSELSTPLLLIHQNAIGQLKLLGWNPTTGSLEYIVSGQYCPAALCILPDHSGISFIDNDRLRVKLFSKRSARAYDFSYPLCRLNTIVWACDGSGYFSALYRGHYALFKIDSEGDCVCMVASETADCMYPNCVGDTVYFLERQVDAEGMPIRYAIKSIVRNETQSKVYSLGLLDEQIDVLMHNETDIILADSSMAQIVVDFGQLPIMHLTMITSSLGWVLGYPVDLDQKYLECTCYIMSAVLGKWYRVHAFNLTLPRDLIFGDDFTQGRLYESLLPLLPRFIRNSLYFPSVDQTGFLGMYRYAFDTHLIDRLTPAGIPMHFFAPLDTGSVVLCGGSLVHQNNVQRWQIPLMTLSGDLKNEESAFLSIISN